MKKIHELLEDVSMDDTNMEINEVFMSKDEKDRVLEAVLKKAGLKKRAPRSKYIFSLAAVMVLVLSFAAVYAQGGLSSIYHSLFGENIKYINNMETAIGESCTVMGTVYSVANKFGKEGTTKAEITLNIVSMVGDENSFYIIAELIKENGESFSDSDYISFEDLRLELGSSGGYTWYQVEDDDAHDNKATFIIAGNREKTLVGKKLNLYLRNLNEYSDREPVKSFDAYEFLLSNSSFINQPLEKNTDKRSEIDIHEKMPEEVLDKKKKEAYLMPKNVLPRKYSAIFVEENFNDIYIDNIGFAEGRLCIRLAYKDWEENRPGEVYFVSKDNMEEKKRPSYSFTEGGDGVEYCYYTFDIENMEELKNYDFKYTLIKKISTTEGEWNVKFKANYKNTTKTVYVNKKTEINGREYTVRNLKISPISVNVEMVNKLTDYKDGHNNLSSQVSVILKDGSVVKASQSGSSTNMINSSINLMFERPVDTSQIEKIIIGSIEIHWK